MTFTDPTLLLYALLFIAALSAGFVDSIAGGGGLITAPVMLSIGAPPHVALSMGKYMGVFGTSLAGYQYIKKGIIKPNSWKWCAFATLCGSILGALAIISMNANFIRKFIPPLLIFIGIYMLIPKSKNHVALQDRPISKQKQIISGLSLGLYDGFIGPGTGSFWTVLYNKFFNQNFMLSSGIARCMNAISNVGAMMVFIFAGKIAWFMGAIMTVGFMLGSYIGARSAIRYGEKYVKPFFIMVVFILAGRLTYLEYFVH